jgi:nitric oxide reductase NorQ protein
VSELLNKSTPAVTKSLGETAPLRGPLPSNEGSELLADSHPTAVRPATNSPFYRAVGDEVEVFRAAARRGSPILLKGPTGCGKTRFVEAMAHELGRDLITVAGHEDMTSADLVGRFLLKGGETVWVDGP